MKRQLNNVAIANGRVNEVFLFSAMARLIQNFTNSVFIEKTHGRRGWVSFNSILAGGIRRKEISDLMILCFNDTTKEIKLSFLQAKFHRYRINPFLSFNGDYLQLELLKNRPNILPGSLYNFPVNILNFSTYKSLTTFGVFYYDINHELDLLYSVSSLLNPAGINIQNGKIIFPGFRRCPAINCQTDNLIEVETTCNINLYVNALVGFRIGAPIPKGSEIENYLNYLLRNIDVHDLGEYLNYFNNNVENNAQYRNHPSILLIKSSTNLN